ncbi:MAG: peptide chain release factor N(5)-glutamine methyltransferase [Burkholderiales bacterium]|nr:peptide chain release factor N(5)-glutamine methyltransferase [Burkholderiales bacterium]
MSGEQTDSRDATAEALRRDARRLQGALGLHARQARLEVERLLMHALGIGRAQLIAHPEKAALAATDVRYAAMLARRLAGEPLDYILSRREFYGLEFEISPAVLIPRADTELLVELALARVPPDGRGCIADLGTGSGCVAIAIACARPGLRVLAIDRSREALRVAARNRLRHRAYNVLLAQGDWLAGVAPGALCGIVSNPPYVRSDDPHLPALAREPQTSLVSGADGLQDWRHIVLQAPRCLAAHGWLLMEHGYDQAASCRALLDSGGFADVFSARDLGGHERVSGGSAGRGG